MIESSAFQRAAEILVSFAEALPSPLNPRERALPYVYSVLARGYAGHRALSDPSQGLGGEDVAFWGDLQDLCKNGVWGSRPFWEQVYNTALTIGALLYATREAHDTRRRANVILPPDVSIAQASSFCSAIALQLGNKNTVRRMHEVHAQPQ